nr:YcxB family protein [Armatimonas rosea]
MTWLAILARCPTPTSTRPVTTEIRAEGIVDRLPEKTNMFPWSAIRRVFVQDGDLMIELVNAGCWIPREAFNDGDAEKCRAMIEALWKSNGTRWPEFAPLKSR